MGRARDDGAMDERVPERSGPKDVMGSTVDGEAHFTSTVGIGEAARRLGIAPSAVRYYEQQGLLDPVPQPGGRRRYDTAALRRLAFVAMGREMGLDLAAIRSVVDPGPGGWAAAVDEQIARLDERIARLQRARAVLAEGRDCPAPDPLRDCPHLRGALDAVLARSGR